MPHTNRKKKNTNNNNNAVRTKRILVVEDDTGWTRVTKQSNNNNNNNNINSHAPSTSTRMTLTTTTTSSTTTTTTTPLHEPGVSSPSSPSTPLLRNLTIPADASVAKTTARYKILEQRWLASESWAVLKAALTSSLSSGTSPSSNERVYYHYHHPISISISTCILFGSGSPTAHVQGWIDRHHVALTQIAVFRSAVAIITQQQQQHPHLRVYAQEPSYNDIDTAFLHTLGIETVNHPVGFELLSSNSGGNSFVYAPGAEVSVAVRALFAQPCMYLGHELDHYHRHDYNYNNEYGNYKRDNGDGESRKDNDNDIDNDRDRENRDRDNDKAIVERFKADHRVIAIPDLDGAQDYPFHQQRLYYRLPFHAAAADGNDNDDGDAKTEI